MSIGVPAFLEGRSVAPLRAPAKPLVFITVNAPVALSQMDAMKRAFAMAERKPSVRLVVPPDAKLESRSQTADPFVAYDFWLSGVSPLTFGCVTEEREVAHYERILARSRSMYTVAAPIEGLHELGVMDAGDMEKLEQVALERSNLRRAANAMRMGLPAHLPEAWRAGLFENGDS